MISLYSDDIIKNIIIKQKRQHTNGFIFHPIKDKSNNSIYIQTPSLFVPFGINNNTSKDNIILSLINKNNDKTIIKFIDLLNQIDQLISSKFKNKNINPIIKSDKIKLKIDYCLIFDENKNKIESMPNNVYGIFIINFYGLWELKDNIYIHLNLSQAKLSIPSLLSEYSFIEKKNIIPPPPPLPNFKLSKPIKKIKNENKNENKNIKVNNNSYNPPSLNDIKSALLKLKQIN